MFNKKKFPDAKIFGITTGLAVMKMNYELGYKPVTFSELTDDPEFWKGCQTCKNFDILTRTDKKMCLCTGMLHDPKAQKQTPEKVNKKMACVPPCFIKKETLVFRGSLENITH